MSLVVARTALAGQCSPTGEKAGRRATVVHRGLETPGFARHIQVTLIAPGDDTP